MYFGFARRISDFDKTIFEQEDAFFISVANGGVYSGK